MNKGFFYLKAIHFFKRRPKLYDILLCIFSPNLPLFNIHKNFLNKLPANSTIVNIGAGPFELRRDIINIDIECYKDIDILGDGQSLPVRSSICDGVICLGLLEHLSDPSKCTAEIKRILKKGGRLFAMLPLIAPYHPRPKDFYRWTEEGVKALFKDFKIIEIDLAAGPTSGFLWIFQEWLAILFSFNLDILYEIFLIIFMLMTFPLKFLDLILKRYKFAKNIALTFYVIAEKSKL